MTIRVTKIINQPLMNSIIVEKHININAENLKGGYHKPSIVIAKMPDHKNGHFVRPNRVALKYLDLKFFC